MPFAWCVPCCDLTTRGAPCIPCLPQAVEALLDENLVSVAPPCTLEHMMLPYASSRGGSIAVFGGENIINIAASLPYLEGRSIVGA